MIIIIFQWATVCIEIQHGILKNVCSSLVLEMKKLSLYNPGLSAASAVSDRLSYLLSNHMSDSTGATVERSLMYSEAARQDTFRKWPHMNYKYVRICFKLFLLFTENIVYSFSDFYVKLRGYTPM